MADFQLIIAPMFLVLFVLVTMFCVNMITEANEDHDVSGGCLRHLADNRRGDRYIYIVAVETGHHMFSTTSSKIMFNLSGTEGNAIARSFDSEEDSHFEKPFEWGKVSRFIMTTRGPLGDLAYLRLWIHEPGIDRSESWFCSRVVIKDLQTNKRYYFPVKNWLGSNAGDGKSERLAEAVPKETGLKAILSCQLICETICYISCFTGGRGTRRMRWTRNEDVTVITHGLMLILLLNGYIIKGVKYTEAPRELLGYECDPMDLVFAVGNALLLTVYLFLMPYLAKDAISYFELRMVQFFRLTDKYFKMPWPDKISCLHHVCITTTNLISALSVSYMGYHTTTLASDNAQAYMRRVGFGLILWVVVFEPLKGLLWAWSIVRRNPDHNIIFPVEQALLPVLPLKAFPRASPELRDETVGSTIADLCQLAITRSARVREDRLFHTMKEVLLLLAAMVIFMGLSNSSKDADGFYYQTQLRTMLDPPSKDLPFDRTLSFLEIKNSEDFWNWANDSLANGIRVSWYDGQPAWDMRGFMNDKVSHAMGNGVIRQIRIFFLSQTSLGNDKCDEIVPTKERLEKQLPCLKWMMERESVSAVANGHEARLPPLLKL